MRALVFSTDGVFAGPVLLAALHAAAYEIDEPADELELLATAGNCDIDLIAVQTTLAPVAMLALARRIRQLDRYVMLFFLVATCDSDFVLAAMRAGVNDILTGCSTADDVADVLRRVLRHEPVARPQTELIAGNRLIGRSKPIEQLRRSIQRVAACDSNVLITGETGTGKELAAELIHANSKRRDRPFVSINCAAIPEGLLESELFGYERGAFTGAHAARERKLQYAHGGTLFLDEVGDMTLYAQAKILRAIESRKVQRLGGNRDIAVNIRIIAATNQNLEQLTSQQKFRQDLFSGSMWPGCICRRCASMPTTSRNWSSRWSRSWRHASTGASIPSIRRSSSRSCATAGRATSANCATWWSRRSSSARRTASRAATSRPTSGRCSRARSASGPRSASRSSAR